MAHILVDPADQTFLYLAQILLMLNIKVDRNLKQTNPSNCCILIDSLDRQGFRFEKYFFRFTRHVIHIQKSIFKSYEKKILTKKSIFSLVSRAFPYNKLYYI